MKRFFTVLALSALSRRALAIGYSSNNVLADTGWKFFDLLEKANPPIAVIALVGACYAWKFLGIDVLKSFGSTLAFLTILFNARPICQFFGFA